MGSCSITIVPDSGIFGGRETTITEVKKPDKSLCFHISAPAIATDYIASFDHYDFHFGQHPLLTDNGTIECTIDLQDTFMLDEEDYWNAINYMIEIEMFLLRDKLAWVLNGNFGLLKNIKILDTCASFGMDVTLEALSKMKKCQKQISGQEATVFIERHRRCLSIMSVTIYCNGKKSEEVTLSTYEGLNFSLQKYISELQTRQPKIIPYTYA